MALQPIIRPISPFPATGQQLLEFDVVGSGNQVVYNELEIRRSDNNALMFNGRKQEFRYQRLLGEGANPLPLTTSDFTVYDIPSAIDLTKEYQIVKDGVIITTGFTIDDVNWTLTFANSLKENVTENATHVSDYKIFQLSKSIDEDYLNSVKVDGVSIPSSEYTIDYENNRVVFTDSLIETGTETLTYLSLKKAYSYTKAIEDSTTEKIFIDGNPITSGYNINHEDKEIYFYQTVTKEEATSPNYKVYKVTKNILPDSEMEVYIDGELVEGGYSVNYTDKSIDFFFPPFPLDKDTKVTITYQTPFAPTGTVTMEYSFFTRTVSVSYVKKIPEIGISQSYLQNGIQYYAIIRIYDVDQVLLGESDPAFFYCFSYPSLNILEINNGETNNQTITFHGTYSQSENEELESYLFRLYDSNQILLSESSEIYSDEISYEFTNLENKKQYYIELKVITQNGMEHSTGLLPFTPVYVTPRFASAIQLENNFNNASVSVECNIVKVTGKPGNQPIVFIDNEYADLRNNSIVFDQGFDVNGDFTLQMHLKNIQENSTFFEISNATNGKIKLQYKDGKIHFQKFLDSEYILQSFYDTLPSLLNDNILFISIKQINGLYDMYTQILEVTQ